MNVDLIQWISKFLDNRSAGANNLGDAIKSEIMLNQQLGEELNRSIIRKLEKQKARLSFKDNIWGVDLVDMQLIIKFNKGIRFLLCVIDIYSKYAWVFRLKDKKV